MNSKTLILIFFILSAKYFCAQTIYQNLIPNGDFEVMRSFVSDTFPNLSDQDSNWIEYFGTNYLFSESFVPQNSVPTNFIGYQRPQKGKNYYCLLVIGNMLKCAIPPYFSEGQSYAQIKLRKKLGKRKMRGILYLSLVDTVEMASSKLGLFFSQTQPLPQYFCPSNTCPFISAVPQIQKPFNNLVIDKINWTKIEGIFQGNGEEWMTLGNFYRANQTDTVRVANFPDSITGCFTEGVAYYIDNLSLVEEDRAVAYFDTAKKYLCVQQGTSKVLGDTLVRPWLFYEWKDANGNIVSTNRNYTYNAAILENTFFTLEIKDTGEYAFITKPIDTIYVSSSISGLGCTYVGVEDVLKDVEAIDFYFAENEIRFNALHERFTVASRVVSTSLDLTRGGAAMLVVKSIDGKTIFKTNLRRGVGSSEVETNYPINTELQKGFYFVEIIYDNNVIKRKKIVVN